MVMKDLEILGNRKIVFPMPGKCNRNVMNPTCVQDVHVFHS